MSGVAPDLTCPICFDLLRDAVETDCGHAYCDQCAREMIRSFGRSCPVCRAQVRLHHPSWTLRGLVNAKIAGLTVGGDPGPDSWVDTDPADDKWPKRYHFDVCRSVRDGVRFDDSVPESLDVRISPAELETHISGLNEPLRDLIPKPVKWNAVFWLGSLAMCYGPVSIASRHREAHARAQSYIHRINRDTFLLRGVQWRLLPPETKQRLAYFPTGWRVQIECAAPTGSLTHQVKHLASVVSAQQHLLQEMQRRLAFHQAVPTRRMYDNVQSPRTARRRGRRRLRRVHYDDDDGTSSDEEDEDDEDEQDGDGEVVRAGRFSGDDDEDLFDATSPPTSPSGVSDASLHSSVSLRVDAASSSPDAAVRRSRHRHRLASIGALTAITSPVGNLRFLFPLDSSDCASSPTSPVPTTLGCHGSTVNDGDDTTNTNASNNNNNNNNNNDDDDDDDAEQFSTPRGGSSSDDSAEDDVCVASDDSDAERYRLRGYTIGERPTVASPSTTLAGA